LNLGDIAKVVKVEVLLRYDNQGHILNLNEIVQELALRERDYSRVGMNSHISVDSLKVANDNLEIAALDQLLNEKDARIAELEAKVDKLYGG
jgi:hypothetical protein